MEIELVAELDPADRHAEIPCGAQHGQLVGEARAHEVEVEDRIRVGLTNQVRPVGEVDGRHLAARGPEGGRNTGLVEELARPPVPVVGGGAAEDSEGARGQPGSRLPKLRGECLPGVLAKGGVESGERRRDRVIGRGGPSGERCRAGGGPSTP